MNGFLFGGPMATRNISDIVLGYNNTVTQQWNEEMTAANSWDSPIF
jgi:hypothetical protein